MKHSAAVWSIFASTTRAGIEYYAGATVTPRAVSKAVLKAVKWVEANQNQLFADSGKNTGAAK